MNPDKMYTLAGELFPLPRSLTGWAVRATLDKLGEYVPLSRHSVQSGTPVYDWIVPPEWNVNEAWLEGPRGRISWEDNPLHLVGYSVPTQATLVRSELDGHIFRPTAGQDPTAIPYVTSYYESRWGFCVPSTTELVRGEYRVNIDTVLDPNGSLDYADLVVPGRSDKEVMFSTYTCHPNMAVDNVAAMVVQTALAQWVASEPRRYTYRFVWAPETIGALVYLSRHLDNLRNNVIAAFTLSCLGHYTQHWGGVEYIPSRHGNTLADRVAIPDEGDGGWGWLHRGSDERQYGSPLADLPVVGVTSRLYGTFPEYHTSADNMDTISAYTLGRDLDTLKSMVEECEESGRHRYRAKFVGDVDLGRRGMYPTLGHGVRDKRYQHVLSYCDGKTAAVHIAHAACLPYDEVVDILRVLEHHELVEAVA